MKIKLDRLELAIFVENDGEEGVIKKLGGKFDRKTKTWRILPYKLIDLMNNAKNVKLDFKLSFSLSDNLFSKLKRNYELRDYQEEAVNELDKRDWRGVIVLPTGAGKTIIGLEAIYRLKVRTLIVVPTLDLMNQWIQKLSQLLGLSKADIALYGGGRKMFGEITISTYASAKTKDFLKAAVLRYGLVIFDEAHHLTGELSREIARRLVAPYRIGLTATPGSKDDEELLSELIGDIIRVTGFRELVEKGHLAPFVHKKIYVKLTEEEEIEYRALMEIYLNYVKKYNVDDEIERFRLLLKDSVRDPNARKAVIARLKAKKIALNAKMKFEVLQQLLEKHRDDKVIIFTRHQETAKRISIMFGIPYIVGEMSKDERKEILSMFKKGIVTKLSTAEVLDEGIDIPSARVGIILAGKPSKRQLIQRIGRLLRPEKGKRAIIYEIVTSRTYDYFASRKRRIMRGEL